VPGCTGYIVGDQGAAVTPEDLSLGLRFVAPSKFSGDKTAYANGTLEYYLWFSPDPYDFHTGLPAFSTSLEEFADIVSENGNLVYRPPTSDFVPDTVFVFRPGNFDHSPPTCS
jgi:hypothetical protein